MGNDEELEARLTADDAEFRKQLAEDLKQLVELEQRIDAAHEKVVQLSQEANEYGAGGDIGPGGFAGANSGVNRHLRHLARMGGRYAALALFTEMTDNNDESAGGAGRFVSHLATNVAFGAMRGGVEGAAIAALYTTVMELIQMNTDFNNRIKEHERKVVQLDKDWKKIQERLQEEGQRREDRIEEMKQEMMLHTQQKVDKEIYESFLNYEGPSMGSMGW